ncbi:2432_t:CDS:2, partial [Rhizophagus irregularis]
MPQTRGRSNSRKDKSSPEQFKPKRGRRRGRNNTPQEEQFLTANSGRGCGRGRGQSNKKSHLLNEILEDSDYEDTIEPSLSGPFNLLPLNNTDLEELDSALAPRPESRNLNTSTPLREVQSNELENLSAPPRLERPASRSLNTSTPLREIQSNGLELSFPSRSERPESRSLNTSTPLREIQSNGLENLSAPPRLERPASRSLNTSTPLREIQSNGLELSSPSRPGLRDLNSPASLRSFNASASSTLPSCFNDMDTIFQLATWLCANPNVLQFANAIYSSMQTSLANGQQFTSSNLTNPTKLQLQSTLHEDKSKVSRDFLEELKCLFLRVRNPPKRALEELVQQIIKCDLNSAEGLEWLRIANRQFGDFRNKFLDGIEKLVDSLKEKRKG